MSPYQWQSSKASSTSNRSSVIGLPRLAMARPTRYFTVLKCKSTCSAASRITESVPLSDSLPRFLTINESTCQ